jgi:20S proteasome alpha/beta subunit
MTIAVGFHCKDGLVLAADRQFTAPGTFKYHAKKFATNTQGFSELAYVFAGYPGVFAEMQQKVDALLTQEPMEVISPAFIKDTIEGVLVGMGWKENFLEGRLCFLLAINELFEPPQMLVFDETSLCWANTGIRVIGCGDTSLIRYLGDRLHSPEMPINEGVGLGAYLIKKATQYIDYCGEPIDVLVINESGIREAKREEVTASIQKMESQEDFLSTLLVQTPFQL